MNILVCIKQVPATSEVEVDALTGVLKRDGTAGKVNPYDLFALELAFSLREEQGGQVDALTMGPPQAAAVLHEALWMGADRGFLLSDRRFAGADVLATGYTLASAVRMLGSYDLILCGKQTTDGDTAQVGPEMAEFLGLDHASYVQDVSAHRDGLTVSVNLGDCVVVQRMVTPCLLTVEKDLNTPRLPSYKRRLAISEDDIVCYSLDDFEDTDESHYGLSGSPTQVERIFPPDANTAREMFRGASAELAQKAYDILALGKYI